MLEQNLLHQRRNDTIDLLTLGHFCVPKIYPNVDFNPILAFSQTQKNVFIPYESTWNTHHSVSRDMHTLF